MKTAAPALPRHRTIFAVDIEASTSRTNPGRARFREQMYELLENVLLDSGIDKRHRDHLDRGDGAVYLVRPVDDLPKTRLLDSVIPRMIQRLTELQAEQPENSFRMRVAIHAGEVHNDHLGWYGEDLDITFRLLNSPRVKKILKQSNAPLVLVVSEEIYVKVIRHGYDGIDQRTFNQTVQVSMAGRRQRGYVQAPAALTA
ncbi:hypothetical protein ACFQ1S_18350 [Kibdelosporangium lantanae]|uniref:Guanylate cyclase domain-containing protein n=1 Tax=Kibdelosporangium lantanae TaxID=1497396 RepID=A0ABW3M9X8_9PSEU